MSCELSALSRHVPSCGCAARYMRPFAIIWSVGAASWLWEHVLFELCMLTCSMLCDEIGERIAVVANVYPEYIRGRIFQKCEYGTVVV